MRRMLLALGAVMGLSTAANADWGTPPPQTPPSQGMYGWNPCFKKLQFWKKNDCGPNGCNTGYGAGNGPGYGAGQPQGTLVYPYNPYIRSPRDFFMYEPGK